MSQCRIRPKLSQKEMEELADFLKVVGEKTRLQIINWLTEESYCVCDLEEKLALPQNLVSHHLKRLKELGLVASKRVKMKTYYRLEKSKLEHYQELLNKLLSGR